jgi:hypothetical protein
MSQDQDPPKPQPGYHDFDWETPIANIKAMEDGPKKDEARIVLRLIDKLISPI